MTTLYSRIGLIISAVCFCVSLSSQDRFNFGFGLSQTNAADQASSLGIELGMKYKLKSFDLGLLINHSLQINGSNRTQIFYNTLFTQSRPSDLILPESLFKNYSRAELYVDYRRKRNVNKPYFGFGVGLHQINNREVTLIGKSMLNLFFNFEPTVQYFQSASIRLGIPFKHFEFCSFVQLTNYKSLNSIEKDNLAFFGTSFKIYLRSQNSLDINHSKIRLFSINAGFSYYISMDKNKADSYRPYLSLYYPINKTYDLFMSYEFQGESFGLDSESTLKELNPEYEAIPLLDNKSSSISALKIKLIRSIPSNGYTNFIYGIGLGVYKLPSHGGYRRLLQNKPTEIVAATSNLGPHFTAGLKTKGLTASVDFNLPIGNIPVHIAIQTGFFLHVNRRHKRKTYNSSHSEHEVIR